MREKDASLSLSPPPAARRRRLVLVLAVLLAGLILRLLLPGLIGTDPYQGDGESYLRFAVNLEKHGTFSWDPPKPSAFRMPGVALQIWLLHKFVDYRSWWMLLPNILLGWGCLLLLFPFFLGLEIDRAVLLVLAASYALIPITDYYAGQMYPEVPAAFLNLLSWYLFFRFLERRRPWQAAAAGLLLGLSLYFRPEMVLNLVILGLGLLVVRIPWSRRLVSGALIAGVVLLALSPWVVRNFAAKGRFIPLIDVSDYRLKGIYRWVNSWSASEKDLKTVAWDFLKADLERLPPGAFDSPEEKETVLALQARGVYTAEEDAVLEELASRRNARHPLRGYVVLPLKRVLHTAFRTERSDRLRSGRIPAFVLEPLWFLYASFGNLVFLLALTAPFLLRGVPPIVRLIAAALILRLLYLAYFQHTEYRYMVSVFPLAYVAAAYCVDRVYVAVRRKWKPDAGASRPGPPAPRPGPRDPGSG